MGDVQPFKAESGIIKAKEAEMKEGEIRTDQHASTVSATLLAYTNSDDVESVARDLWSQFGDRIDRVVILDKGYGQEYDFILETHVSDDELYRLMKEIVEQTALYEIDELIHWWEVPRNEESAS